MVKFNRSMIKGLSEQKMNNSEENDKTQGKGLLSGSSLVQDENATTVKLGAGLLSEASKKAIKMKIENIPRNMIEKNEKNDRSINGIGELAWSIQHCGLKNPLHVKRTGTGYKLLGGERRLTAIDALIQDPNIEEWNEDTLIPVVVQDFDDIDLPLDDEMKELFAMITTNKEARKYTDGDKAKEIAEWKRVVAALRAAGVDEWRARNERGEEVVHQIKGRKTRDIIADTTDYSRGVINSFEKVANRGSERINEGLLNNDISVGVATQIIDATDSKEEQDETFQKIQESGDATKVIKELKINKQKIKEAEEVLKKKREENGDEDSIKSDFIDVKKRARVAISLDQFKSDTEEITKLLAKRQIKLDEEEILRYYNSIRELEKVLKVN